MGQLVLAAMIVLSLSSCASPGAGPPAPTPTSRPNSPAPPTASGDSLRALAQEHDLLVGAAVSRSAFEGDEAYKEALAREFSALTLENYLKFEPLRPSRASYHFDVADEIVDYAEVNDMVVRGHTLVWHHQLPRWLTGRDWTEEELSAILEEHIHTVVTRYQRRIYAWDVVNEAINEDGTGLRASIWLETLGPGYIEQAFRWAHEADPDAVLCYNDYMAYWTGDQKLQAVHDLLTSLMDKGVPVHCVGFQMHLRTEWDFFSRKQVQRWMQKFADLGLEIHVTELDVAIPMPVSESESQRQAQMYEDVLDTCMGIEACTTLVMWGFTDRYSWIPEWFPGYGSALILDEDLQRKPAYDALRRALVDE
jgi:endo-1,4-beta-xylanase